LLCSLKLVFAEFPPQFSPYVGLIYRIRKEENRQRKGITSVELAAGEVLGAFAIATGIAAHKLPKKFKS
jgi:hypothetical protein